MAASSTTTSNDVEGGNDVQPEKDVPKDVDSSPTAASPTSNSDDVSMSVENSSGDQENNSNNNDTKAATTTSTTTRDDDDDDENDDKDEKKMDSNDDGGGGETNEDKPKEEKKKIRAEDWPLRDISEPHEHDVLYGRGGGTNHHPGNKRYRKMVEDRKLDYINSKRLDKPLVALEIIREWRGQDPPGRFLKMDEKTGLWHDVGDKKAREKTSQALREKAPQIRVQQEKERFGKDQGEHPDDVNNNGSAAEQEEEGGNDEIEESNESPTTAPATSGRTRKETKFADKTKAEAGKHAKKPVLARDHTLGREYLEAGEAVTLDGFSWQDPFQQNSSSQPVPLPVKQQENQRMSSQGSYGPPPPLPPPGYQPTARIDSHGSIGSFGAHIRFPSHGSIGPPPIPLPGPPTPGFSGMSGGGDDRHFRYTSSGRYESWGSMPPPPPPPQGYSPYPVGSWTQRDHSLSQNPLAHASISQPAHIATFDSRNQPPGQWGGPPPPPSHVVPPPMPPNVYMEGPIYSGGGSAGPMPPPPPPAAVNGGGLREYSNGYPQLHAPPAQPSPRHHHHSLPQRRSNTSPSYDVDPAVASTWAGQQQQQAHDPTAIAKSWSGGSSGGGSVGGTRHSGEEIDYFRSNSPRQVVQQHQQDRSHHHHYSNSSNSNNSQLLPKPDIVKRATSNQNETFETKRDLRGPSVKRAALNRDSSETANRLKAQYLPGYRSSTSTTKTVYLENKNVPANGNDMFDHEEEMNLLSDNLEQSKLDHGPNVLEDDDETPLPLEGDPAPPGRYPMSPEDRQSSIDQIPMDLMVPPPPAAAESKFGSTGRSSTIEALALDFDGDAYDHPGNNSSFTRGITNEGGLDLPRPLPVAIDDRLTTNEFLDMVNAPLPDDEPELLTGKR